MTDDDTVRISLANTLIYVGVVVPVSVALGLGAALLIEADVSLRGFYRAVLFPAGDGDPDRHGDRLGASCSIRASAP